MSEPLDDYHYICRLTDSPADADRFYRLLSNFMRASAELKCHALNLVESMDRVDDETQILAGYALTEILLPPVETKSK